MLENYAAIALGLLVAYFFGYEHGDSAATKRSNAIKSRLDDVMKSNKVRRVK